MILQAVAERIRYLADPLSTIKFTVEDAVEDKDCEKCKDSLTAIDKANRKCIKIFREIVDLTQPYFKLANMKDDETQEQQLLSLVKSSRR